QSSARTKKAPHQRKGRGALPAGKAAAGGARDQAGQDERRSDPQTRWVANARTLIQWLRKRPSPSRRTTRSSSKRSCSASPRSSRRAASFDSTGATKRSWSTQRTFAISAAFDVPRAAANRPRARSLARSLEPALEACRVDVLRRAPPQHPAGLSGALALLP